MELRLDGKAALVTGASSGIGQGIATLFAEAGADVSVLYASNTAGAEATAETIRATGGRGRPDTVRSVLEELLSE